MIFGLGAELLPLESDLYGYFYIASYTLVVIVLFCALSYRNIMCKTLCFTYVIFSCLNIILQISYGYYKWTRSELSIILISSMFISFLFCLFKSYSLPDDTYELDTYGVYIVFKKPRNFIEFMLGLLNKPVSSVSVVISGLHFRYKKGMPYHCCKYEPKENHVYIKTKFRNSYALKALIPLINKEWSKNDNCCHAVLRLYPHITSSRLRAIPCFLINQIIKE